MSDRMNSLTCLNCGTPLIEVSPWQLCSACQKQFDKNAYEAAKRKKVTNPEVIRKRKAIHPCQLRVRKMER